MRITIPILDKDPERNNIFKVIMYVYTCVYATMGSDCFDSRRGGASRVLRWEDGAGGCKICTTKHVHTYVHMIRWVRIVSIQARVFFFACAEMGRRVGGR